MSAANITAAEIQRLRKATGAGMLDAKRALEDAGGDFDAATRLLRERGQAQSLARADRESSQGAVALVIEGNVGAIAELRSETDFVAKSADFVRLVETLAAAVAAEGPAAVANYEKEIQELAVSCRENIAPGRMVRYEAGPRGVVDGYLHVQNERGVLAVLVELEGGSRSLAHDLAVHIAFARPRYIAREEVPAEEVAAERATLEAIARNENKPEAAIPKIVEGRLAAWYKDAVLLDQPYVRDEKKTIAELLGDARVRRFDVVRVGS